MFRTLRDLILRPGYMIRDYLMGMQMAYFPPFQMLFLLTTFSFFVIYGFNIKGQTLDDSKKEAITIMEEGEEGDADDGLDAEVGMKADSRYALLGVSDGNHLYRQHDVHLRNCDALLLRSSRMGESHLHVHGHHPFEATFGLLVGAYHPLWCAYLHSCRIRFIIPGHNPHGLALLAILEVNGFQHETKIYL
jgi:hypothetical protein